MSSFSPSDEIHTHGQEHDYDIHEDEPNEARKESILFGTNELTNINEDNLPKEDKRVEDRRIHYPNTNMYSRQEGMFNLMETIDGTLQENKNYKGGTTGDIGYSKDMRQANRTEKSPASDFSDNRAPLNAKMTPRPFEQEKSMNISDDPDVEKDTSRISAYARLDFENSTFFVQTLQVLVGRQGNNESYNNTQHEVDIHISSKKAISRRHAKIFYNFGTQRFELSILGRNGAFVDDLFMEKGMTIPLTNGTKIQIGDIAFSFILPSTDFNGNSDTSKSDQPFNPKDAINLRSNLYTSCSISKSPTPNIPQKETKTLVEADSANSREPLNKISPSTLPSNEPIESYKEHALSGNNNIDNNNRRKSVKEDPEVEKILDELRNENSDPVLVENTLKGSMLESQENTGYDAKKSGSVELIENPDKDGKEDSRNTNFDSGSFLGKSEDIKADNEGMDLSMLDQEIAHLGPIIDAHNQELIHEDVQKTQVEGGERSTGEGRQETLQFPSAPVSSLSPSSQSLASNFLSQSSPPSLIGKPVASRMGKPAAIQPLAARYYGKNFSTSAGNNMSPQGTVDGHSVSTRQYLPGSMPSGINKFGQEFVAGSLGSHLTTGFNSYPSTFHFQQRPSLEVAIYPVSAKEKENLTPRSSVISTSSLLDFPKVCELKSDEQDIERFKLLNKKGGAGQQRKVPKGIFGAEQIPETFRTKPSISYSLMIWNVLRNDVKSTGLSFSEIIEGIKQMYPFYKYCPDGWQSCISHTLLLSKQFKRRSNDTHDAELVWLIDNDYINERERIRKKQQEVFATKAHSAAIRAEGWKQRQGYDSLYQRTSSSIDNGGTLGGGLHIPGMRQESVFQKIAGNENQRPKTIAELASEIRRDGIVGNKIPFYFKPQLDLQRGSDDQPGKGESYGSLSSSSQQMRLNEVRSIKDQLEANRSLQTHSKAPIRPAYSQDSTTDGVTPKKSEIKRESKKSLTYLQKELFNLYKSKNLSYNTGVTTEIITKALATTISQVNIIGSKVGCGENALDFLVEKAPQQVSKILDIALTKSIKDREESYSRQNTISQSPSSKSLTPTALLEKGNMSIQEETTRKLANVSESNLISARDTNKAPEDSSDSAKNVPFNESVPGHAHSSQPFPPSLTKPPKYSERNDSPQAGSTPPNPPETQKISKIPMRPAYHLNTKPSTYPRPFASTQNSSVTNSTSQRSNDIGNLEEDRDDLKEAQQDIGISPKSSKRSADLIDNDNKSSLQPSLKAVKTD